MNTIILDELKDVTFINYKGVEETVTGKKWLFSGDYEQLNEEHRKGASYYCDLLFTIDEDTAIKLGNIRYEGTWMAFQVMGEYDWGLETDYIKELHRVRQKEVVTYVWEKVK